MSDVAYIPVDGDPFNESAPVPGIAPPQGLGIPQASMAQAIGVGDVPTGLSSSGIGPIDKLFGLGGQERFQLWPERMVRSGLSLPRDVASGQEPVIDQSTGHTADPVIQRAQDIAGMAALGTLPSPERGSLGVFLGPMGKRIVELQGERQLPEHPAAVANMADAAIRDQALREAHAQGTIAMRRAAGLPSDDVFKTSGWSEGFEGNPRREIPDIGAKLTPALNSNGEHLRNQYGLEFKWEHPLADLHKAYDIPNITVGLGHPNALGGGAMFDPATRQIIVHASPYTKNGMNFANSVIAHEFQHAIQNAEGHAPGGNPVHSPLFKEYYEPSEINPLAQVPYPGDVKSAMASEIQRSLFGGYSDKAVDVYNRIAGEVEARNAELRRRQGYRYLSAPQATEDVPRAKQLHPYSDVSRPSTDYLMSFASGGSVPDMPVDDNQLIFNPEFMSFLRESGEDELLKTPVDMFMRNTGRLIPVEHDPFTELNSAMNPIKF